VREVLVCSIFAASKEFLCAHHPFITMRRSCLPLLASAMMAVAGVSAQAQDASTEGRVSVDFIVAVVNSEPITNNDVRSEFQRAQRLLVRDGRPVPNVPLLVQKALEILIQRKTQLQYAREIGLKVDSTKLNQAEEAAARDGGVTVQQMRLGLERLGTPANEFRSRMHDEILLGMVRDRFLKAAGNVSEDEIDSFIRQQVLQVDLSKLQINMAQILISVPETANATQQAALKTRAQRAYKRAIAGEDFAALVREFSDAPDLSNGGMMGLRTADRYPETFVQATVALGVGAVANMLQSGAGFHVIKVMEKIYPGLPTATIQQTEVRHIVLNPDSQRSQEHDSAVLTRLKTQIASGQADFASLAKEHSQDESAPLGGYLGWTTQGTFEPEFEAAINRLPVGEMSNPVLTRFGTHLIQVTGRRLVSLNPTEQRRAVRAMLTEFKREKAYQSWATDLRNRAYIEMRVATP